MSYKQCKDQLEKSIRGEKMDRHAFFFFMDAPFVCSAAKVSMSDYYADPAVMMECQLQVYDRIGGCGFLYADYGVVAEGTAYGGAVKTDPIGVMALKASGMGTLEDAAALKPADLYGDNLMAQSLKTMEYMVSHKPEGYEVETTRIMAPFTAAAMLRGVSDFYVDIYEEPEMAEALMDLILNDSIRFVKEQERILGHDTEYILVADDLSSFISKEMYDEYVKPRYEKFYSAFPNAQRWLHNDANASRVASSIADAGFQLWHAGSSVNIHKAMADCRNEVSIAGNLSPLQVLQEGNPDTVYQAVCDFVRSCEGNTKHVISPGGYLAWNTPVENVKAFIQAVEDCSIS